MSDATQHIADLADDFVHGLLPAEKAAVVELHCSECEACRAALEEARRRLAALQAVPPLEPSGQLVANTVQAVAEHDATRRLRVKRVFKWLAAGTAAAAALHGPLNGPPPSY